MSTPVFIFTAKGRPATQGSMKGFVIPGNGQRKARAIVTHGRDSKIVAWRKVMHEAFRLGVSEGYGFPLAGAVSVRAEVILPRLAAHPKTPRGAEVGRPVGKGDLDKHQRAIGDSLTTAGVLADDGLICEWRSSKRFAKIGEEPGVTVEVQEL